MNQAILHHFKRIRAHQREHNGGSAITGEHAISAHLQAKSHIHFMANLRKDIAASKKRGRAAKRGWKTRRANA